jgi:hypothetical protein
MGTGVVQAAEHLPSKCKALSSNPSTTKKEKNDMGKTSHCGTLG